MFLKIVTHKLSFNLRSLGPLEALGFQIMNWWNLISKLRFRHFYQSLGLMVLYLMKEEMVSQFMDCLKTINSTQTFANMPSFFLPLQTFFIPRHFLLYPLINAKLTLLLNSPRLISDTNPSITTSSIIYEDLSGLNTNEYSVTSPICLSNKLYTFCIKSIVASSDSPSSITKMKNKVTYFQ